MTPEHLMEELRTMRSRFWRAAFTFGLPLLMAIVGGAGAVWKAQAEAEQAREKAERNAEKVKAVEERVTAQERTSAMTEEQLRRLRRAQTEHARALNWIGESVEQIARQQGAELPTRPVVPTEPD